MKEEIITLTQEQEASLDLRILYKDKELVISKVVLTLITEDKPFTETNRQLIEDLKK